jgi:ATP-binding cassette, subfamily B, bacterial PglK
MKADKNLSKSNDIKKYIHIWHLSPIKYRKQAIIIILLGIFSSFLETLGVGLVIPALAMMLDENVTDNYPILQQLINFFGQPSRTDIAIYGMLLLASSYAIKSLFLAFYTWKQSIFIYSIKASVSLALFKKYMHIDYASHLQRNSSQLLRNLTTECSFLVENGLKPAIIIISEVLVTLSLIILLFTFEPLGTISLILLIGLSVFSFHFFTSKIIKKWGRNRQHQEGQKIQKAQEGLGGVKEIKLLGRESYFLDQYEQYHKNTCISERNMYALGQTPRLLLETLGVSGLAAIAVVMVMQGKTPESIIPTIGLFGAAAFRILPSISRIINSIHNLRYIGIVVDLVLNDLGIVDKKPITKTNDLSFKNTIEIKNISYKYPGTNLKVLKNISMSFKKGEAIAIVGPSGSGKSTLVDLILGLLTPSSGKIMVDGKDVQEGIRSWQNLIGYVQQKIYLTDDTLLRNIAFGMKDTDICQNRVMEVVKSAQLFDFIKQLPDGLDTIVGERGERLSGGQLQRIGIARALYHNPDVLVFDEATSALDNNTEKDVMKSIDALKGKKTIIIIAHRLSTIKNCDKTYKIDMGHLVDKSN